MGVAVKTEALIFTYHDSVLCGAQVLIDRTLLDSAQCVSSTSFELSFPVLHSYSLVTIAIVSFD